MPQLPEWLQKTLSNGKFGKRRFDPYRLERVKGGAGVVDQTNRYIPSSILPTTKLNNKAELDGENKPILTLDSVTNVNYETDYRNHVMGSMDNSYQRCEGCTRLFPEEYTSNTDLNFIFNTDHSIVPVDSMWIKFVFTLPVLTAAQIAGVRWTVCPQFSIIKTLIIKAGNNNQDIEPQKSDFNIIFRMILSRFHSIYEAFNGDTGRLGRMLDYIGYSGDAYGVNATYSGSQYGTIVSQGQYCMLIPLPLLNELFCRPLLMNFPVDIRITLGPANLLFDYLAAPTATTLIPDDLLVTINRSETVIDIMPIIPSIPIQNAQIAVRNSPTGIDNTITTYSYITKPVPAGTLTMNIPIVQNGMMPNYSLIGFWGGKEDVAPRYQFLKTDIRQFTVVSTYFANKKRVTELETGADPATDQWPLRNIQYLLAHIRGSNDGLPPRDYTEKIWTERSWLWADQDPTQDATANPNNNIFLINHTLGGKRNLNADYPSTQGTFSLKIDWQAADAAVAHVVILNVTRKQLTIEGNVRVKISEIKQSVDAGEAPIDNTDFDF